MAINLKIFLLILGLVSMGVILYMVKRNKIMLRHGIFWEGLIIIVMLLVLVEKYLKPVATFVGIETVSNMIFLGGFIVLLAIALILTSAVSYQKIALIKLTQELALTNHKLREISNEKGKKSAK